MNKTVDDRIHEGHRGRMRAKFAAHGSEIFDTYELLEMLLYHTVPYKDTNPIAKKLLARFGSLDGVLSASVDELTTVSGVGEVTARLIESVGSASELFGAMLKSSNSSIYDKYSDTGNFWVDYFAKSTAYRVALMMLDNGMRLIDVCDIGQVDYGCAAIKPAELINRVIKNNAAAVITAHYHPNGPLFPTESDRTTNFAVTNALGSLGVLHLEHFLVSGDEYLGIMEHTKERFRASDRIYQFLVTKEEALTASSIERTRGGGDHD